MRVLITGGYGFIGSAVCARLLANGHQVIGAGRKTKWAKKRFPNLTWRFCDFNKNMTAQVWRGILDQVDAVVNCVGVLQDGGSDSTQNAHVTGLQALLDACEIAGIRKFIHLSAIGANEEARTRYARTKFEGEERVKKSKLDWVILQPSLVLDRNTYGGSALIRTLAGAPMIIPLVYGQTQFQPVHMQDLTQIVSKLLDDQAPVRVSVEIAGPERLSLRQIVTRVRGWLGFGPAVFINIAPWMAAPAFWVGDLLGAMGIRNPLRTTARKQMQFDVGGDPKQITKLIGYETNSIATIFAADPASSADRFEARSRVFLIAGQIILSWYWILSGLIPLLFTQQISFGVLADAGLPTSSHWAVWFFGGLADILLGVLLLFGVRTRAVCIAMIALSFGYLGVISLTIPQLWLDPLAPVLKVFPMMALAAWIAAVAQER